MEEKKTSEVEKILKNTQPNQLERFYKENKESMMEDQAFYSYMKEVVSSKNIFLKDIYIAADVTESYGEKILRMTKRTRSRDLILRLCIAGHFSVEEINKALKLYGFNPLYAKEKRDACIMMAVHHRTYELIKLDEMLEEHGFKKIMPE